MQTNELREKYLEFFQSKGHTRCDSDVLVPTWDPSVLFTPAGMNQFKDHFLGKVKLDFTRATTCQKCLRTGDIENVGRTAYHHTFFEMLGNFSFGDYFKRDAVHWAWEFLTDKKWLAIPSDRLTVTVYLDDDEAADIWRDEIGLSEDRIERMGEHDNFWPAGAPSEGPDGVCGPCSEIFYHPDEGKEVEIWNLVFTQFNRVGDPPDNLRPLPSKNIDTGMGLERCAATLQGAISNFHIDILLPIVHAAAEVCGVSYTYDSDDGRRCRRITDHVRACTMAVHENVYPGAQKEKYVIRRLLRRAVLDGHQMGLREPFLYQLVPAVVDQMKAAYPELTETSQRVADVIKNEESNFFGTIDAGLARIERIFSEMKSASRVKVDGQEAADLYQTYGVPPEVFETMAAENELAFDWDRFRAAMEAHSESSGKLTHTVMDAKGPVDTIKKALPESQFLGYDQVTCSAELKFIIADGALADSLEGTGADHPAQLVLDRTSFYGESGGQVGDSGVIAGEEFEFQVTDTQRDGNLYLHAGHLISGTAVVGETVEARVDVDRREGIKRAHSATHVLHYALQKNLGTHAQQQGSKVDDDVLRFDFTNMSPVEVAEIDKIEMDVRDRVEAGEPIRWDVVPLAEARQAGAMMLFGEKYPDPVRMVSMGQFSKELCGGTHLTNTSQVGQFEIVSEEGVAAGIRRITAFTGQRADQHCQKVSEELSAATKALGIAAAALPEAANRMMTRVRELKKQLSSGTKPASSTEAFSATSESTLDTAQQKSVLQLTARALNVPLFDVASRVQSLAAEVKKLESDVASLVDSADVSVDSLLDSGQQIGDTTVVVQQIPGGNSNLLRQLIDQIRKKTPSSAVLLATSQGDEKVILVAGLSKDLVKRGASAGNWVKEVAPIVGGGGGGKPDMAQAGGKQPEKIGEACSQAEALIRKQLA